MARKPPTIHEAPEGYVKKSQLQQRLGITMQTLSRRIEAQGITEYAHPKDYRTRLISNEDADRLEKLYTYDTVMVRTAKGDKRMRLRTVEDV